MAKKIYSLLFTIIITGIWSQEFIDSKQTIPTSLEKNIIVLNLSNDVSTKKTKIYFSENATSGFDSNYDLKASQNKKPTLFIGTCLMDNYKEGDFESQYLPTNLLDNQLSIPLSVQALANETITFSIDKSSKIPQGIEFYLEDTEKNTFTKLNEVSYKITLTNAINGTGRFYLRNTYKIAKIKESTNSSNIKIYKTANKSFRITGLQPQENVTLKMYNIIGKKVFSKEFSAKNMNDFMFPANLKTGMYLIKMTTEKQEYNKKIII